MVYLGGTYQLYQRPLAVGVHREVVFSRRPTMRHVYYSHQLPKTNLVTLCKANLSDVLTDQRCLSSR